MSSFKSQTSRIVVLGTVATMALGIASASRSTVVEEIDWTLLSPVEACGIAFEQSTPFRMMGDRLPALHVIEPSGLRVQGTAVALDERGTQIQLQVVCSFERTGTAPRTLETTIHYL
jgi:hypothetical protein